MTDDILTWAGVGVVLVILAMANALVLFILHSTVLTALLSGAIWYIGGSLLCSFILFILDEVKK